MKNLVPTLLLFTVSSVQVQVQAQPQTRLCTVPEDYASLQEAVNDNSCTEIQFGPGEFDGSVTIERSIDLTGSGSANTDVMGVITVSGTGTLVDAKGFKVVGGCNWLTVSEGGALYGTDLVVSVEATPDQCEGGDWIFDNGFETSP